MLILGIETTTRFCSTALLENDQVLAEYNQKLTQTHSEKLLPLIDTLFKNTFRSPREVDAISVASGPGSFTGLRIGVSTARAMAQGLGIPALGINTLEALSRTIIAPGNLVCPMMDAKKQQVYAAVYSYSHNHTSINPYQLLEPTVLKLEELLEFLRKYSQQVLFPGDGAYTYYDVLQRNLLNRYKELPAPLSHPRASQIAWCALNQLSSTEKKPSYLELKPEYLRASEAERKYRNKDL